VVEPGLQIIEVPLMLVGATDGIFKVSAALVELAIPQSLLACTL
jgi:hypothetical protein